MAEHEGGHGGGGAIRELLAVFSFGVETEELEKGKSKLNEFLGELKEIAEAIAVAFAAEQIYEFAEGQAKAMNAIERTGAQLGITTDRVQEFQFAAKSLGLEADSLLNLMGRLQVSQQAAAQGGKEQAQAFRALGTNVRDANGHFKAVDELMLDVADGIEKMHDPSQRAATAVALFGRSGRELLPFLEEGREGVEEYFKAFKELGGGYTEAAMKAGKEFDKQQAKTNLTLTALKNTIAKSLLPVVTAISHGFQIAAKWLNDVAKNSYIVEVALGALGAVAAGFAINMAIAFAPVMLIAAGIAFLLLAVEDLVTFLTGGESEIGDIIDKIFGKGAQTEALKSIRDGWESIKETFKNLVPYIVKVWDFFKWTIDNLGKASGAIGDTVGKLANAAGLNKGPRTGGGLSYEQNVARQQAEKLLAARAAGKEFHLTEIPASFRGHESEFMSDVQQWATQLQSGQFLPQGTIGPLNSPSNTQNVNVAVNVPPGLDEKQVGEHVARQVGEVMKQERRAAAATVPRAGS